eukprot:m.442898 g.442898  ORF g.442898 m.442898 type:complete len:302 (+) comp18875_c0_seq1:1076-1981(+)
MIERPQPSVHGSWASPNVTRRSGDGVVRGAKGKCVADCSPCRSTAESFGRLCSLQMLRSRCCEDSRGVFQLDLWNGVQGRVFCVLSLQIDHLAALSSPPHPGPKVKLPFIEVKELAVAVLVVRVPFAFVSILIRKHEQPLPVALPIEPTALVDAAVRVLHAAPSTLLSVEPLAVVHVAVLVVLRPISVLPVVHPVPGILFLQLSFSHDRLHPISVSDPIRPISVVNTTLLVHAGAFAVALVQVPLARILIAIGIVKRLAEPLAHSSLFKAPRPWNLVNKLMAFHSVRERHPARPTRSASRV